MKNSSGSVQTKRNAASVTMGLRSVKLTETMATVTPPIFFQQFAHFIQGVPHLDTATANPRLSPLLKNYLAHYRINFSEDGQAAHYRIWQSRIMGVRIVEQCWQPAQATGQTLVVAHGYFDHTGIYGKIIAWGLSRGYRVHVFDLQGHGLSGGKRASISSFDEYSEILHHILQRENYPNYILLGQSTGCSIIANYLLQPDIFTRAKVTPTKVTPAKPEQVILLAPLVRSRSWAQLRYAYCLLRRLLSSVPRRFEPASHDTHFNQFLAYRDPLQAQRIPLSWLGAMDAWYQKLKQLEPRADISPLIIQGTGDTTVDWHYNLPQLQRRFPQAKAFMVADANHRLLNESNHYWQQIVKIMNARTQVV